MSYEVIPQELSISAMRSSGYRDTAHAVAELIDNSIQAGEATGGPVIVELICVDEVDHSSGSSRRRLRRIGVLDNAAGMNPNILREALQFGKGTHLKPDTQKGIGKFGMGLPNASISQCRKVEVWSWQDGKVFYTYLDVGAIEKGTMREVPVPVQSAIPDEWLKLASSEIGRHGTLVVWSDLDRVTWRQSAALLRNAEFLIGRIYRYFISDKKAQIRLAAYEKVASEYSSASDSLVRPNDPLYLMKDTTAPPPYDRIPAFDSFGEPQTIKVRHNGKSHDVRITASICKPEIRYLGGDSPIGKDTKKNVGISVVRADRELELNHSFEIPSDPRERWWHVEVAFEPGLDAVFGVTNNKQSATEFRRIEIEEDAAESGMSVAEYRERLGEDEDPRLLIYEINAVIFNLLKTMRAQVVRMREGSRTAERPGPGGADAETIATRALRRRQERLGETGASDVGESAAPAARAEELSGELEQEGVDADRAKEIAVEYVSRKIKFLFRNSDFPGSAVFDVTSKAGVIIVTLNTRHPAHKHLFELLHEDDQPDNEALKGLKLLLTAWARMEDESNDARRTELDDARSEWGRIARDFMQEDE